MLRLVPAAEEGADGAARLEIEDGSKQTLHCMLADTIGVGHDGGRELTIFAYPQEAARRLCWLSSSGSSSEGDSGKARPRRARHLRLVAETVEAAVGWKVAIEAELDSEFAKQQGSGSGRGRARKLLVLVNPVSGRRRARLVYQTVVEPMLTQGGIEHHLMGESDAFVCSDPTMMTITRIEWRISILN